MNLSSGYPFWLVRYGLPFDYPALQKDVHTDVVIMGGGISGALMSYYLTNAGVDHIVVDGRTIGLGSTCASTALLQYEIDKPLCELQNMVGLYNAVRAYRLCDESIDTLADIAAKIKFNEFEKLDSLYFAAAKKDTKFIEEEFTIRKKHGFKVALLKQAEIRQQFNLDSPSAILSEQGAQTNAYSLAHALHQYAIKKGTQVFDRTCIAKIEHSTNGVVLTTDNKNKIHTKKLVYASGYESVKYIDKKIVDLNSTYAVCSEQGNADEAPFKRKALLWNTADPYLYMRNTFDNRILIGGRDEEFFNPKKRDALLMEKTAALVKDFKKMYPTVSFKPEFSWCGTFGATKDGLPFIGEYAKLPNSFFALGFGGNGITFSLIAAEIIKDLITDKKNNDKEIFAFSRL
jgi:glycine/D-amino acid oxidase-like deaminating enzyme